MIDVLRIKRNVAKMVAAGAPEAEIDGYIAGEGATAADLRNAAQPPVQNFNERFAAGEDQPPTRMHEGAPGFGYGAADYLKGQLPFADEITRMIGGDEAVAKEKLYAQDYARAHPIGSKLAAVAGLASTGPGKAVGLLRGAGGAGAMGGIYGASEGTGFEERAANAGKGALLGAGVGAAAPAIVSGVGRAFSRGTTASSVDALKAAKTAKYGEVDKVGAAYSPKAIDFLAASIRGRLKQASPTHHDKAVSMAADISERAKSGQPMTLTQLDELRQEVYRDVVKSGDDANKFWGEKIIDEIDTFIDSAWPSQMASGNPVAASKAIKAARAANTTYRKAEMVDEALLKAVRQANTAGSGGNVENKIRQAIEHIRSNPKKARSFTKEELALMDKIIAPETKGRDFMRLVGKLSPSGSGLMAALGLGATAFNPLLGAAPAVGMLAKTLSESSQARQIAALQNRIGGAATPPPRPIGANPLGRLITGGAIYGDQRYKGYE